MSNYTRVLALAAKGDPSGLLLKLRSRTPLLEEDFDRLALLIQPLLPDRVSHSRVGRPLKSIEAELVDALTIWRAVEMYHDRAADQRARKAWYGRRSELIREVASECGVTEKALTSKLSQRKNLRKKPLGKP